MQPMYALVRNCSRMSKKTLHVAETGEFDMYVRVCNLESWELSWAVDSAPHLESVRSIFKSHQLTTL